MKLIIGKKISEKDYEAATKETFSEKKKENPEQQIDLVDIFEDDKNIEIIKRIAQEYAS